jgi:hypothetical protein
MREPKRYSMQMPPEAIRHLASGSFVPAVCRHVPIVPSLADASANLFDAAVNRKVDGTFTDLTQ